MLKDILSKAADVAQVVTDTVKPPALANAQEASEARNRELVSAQTAMREAETKLNCLHDAGADTKAIAAAEAKLASANIAADRADRAYKAAQKRLVTAQASETSKERAAIQAKLDNALVIRVEAAEAIDRAAAAIAHEAERINAQDEIISSAVRAGVAPESHGVTLGAAKRTAEFALIRANAISLTLAGDIPTAREWVAKQNEALVVSH